MSFVLTLYSPSSSLITQSVINSDESATTSVPLVTDPQIASTAEELAGEVPCNDGFALPGGICLPRWIVGVIVLLLLAKIGLDLAKMFI